MRILITGATGFVGKALVKRLSEGGHTLKLLVRRQINNPMPNVDVVVVGDLNQVDDFTEYCKGCDVVVHLAARVHVMRDTDTDPRAAFQQANQHLTMRLAEQTQNAGVKRFVFLSTVKVNGEQTDGQPFCPDGQPNPHGEYAKSKYDAEQSLLKIVQQPNVTMDAVIIRPPLIYGPNVKGNLQVIARAISKGFPLPLAGINNRRSLLSVYNLVDFITTCITHPLAANQVYLVADPEPYSTTELVTNMATSLSCKQRLFFVPKGVVKWLCQILGKQDIYERLWGNLVVDTQKTAELAWHPPYTFLETFKR